MTTEFAKRVLDIVRKIPRGKTMTYKEIAIKVGNPGAARAVGSIMKKNYDLTIPCHRVIKSNGTVGDYNRGGAEVKNTILEKEQIR